MSPRLTRWLGFASALGGVCALLYWAQLSSAPLSDEAKVFEAGGRLLLANTTEGRQALVSSMWWPPLPFLLRLTAFAVLPHAAPGVASVLLSALFGVGVLLMVHEALRAWGFGIERFPLTVSLLAAPPFLSACVDGSSTTLMAFFVLALAHGLSRWFATRRLRELVSFSFAAAGLMVTAPEGALGTVLALLLFWIIELCSRRSLPQKNAALLIGVLPSAYVLGLWMLMCWLLMGDGFYAFRPLADLRIAGDALVDSVAHTNLDPLWLAAPALLAVLGAAFRRDVVALVIGLLVLVFALAHAGLSGTNLPWARGLVIGGLAPLALLALLRGFAPGAGRDIARRAIGSALAVALMLGAYAERIGVEITRPGVSLDGTVRAEVEAHALTRSPYAKVFVCGYEGLSLVGARRGHVFRHALDFNFNKTKDDYRGHALFVMVPRPEGRNAVESVHRHFPGLYRYGWDETLFDRDWGHWRLYEIIESRRSE